MVRGKRDIVLSFCRLDDIGYAVLHATRATAKIKARTLAV